MRESTNPRSREYIVLPREDGQWILTRTGTPSESAVFASLEEAVAEGRRHARNAGVRLRIQKENRTS
jgi:hypothetical protein